MLNTTRLVNNLLDMARIQSGGFNLKKEWLTLEEVVGSALQMLEPGLSSPINLSLPEPLTLIHVDGPLFERVLINLLENARNMRVRRPKLVSMPTLRTKIYNWMSGITAPVFRRAEQTIFDKFARGNKESAVPGVGLDWQFVGRLWMYTAAPLPRSTDRKVVPVFVLHFPSKPLLNLKTFMRICDKRSDC